MTRRWKEGRSIRQKENRLKTGSDGRIFGDQRLAVRFSADRIGNKSSNQKIAQTNGCLLVIAESRRYGTTGTANGANCRVLLVVVMIVVCVAVRKKKTAVGAIKL